MPFEPVIGLEVHAQLTTQSKIFCACSTAFGDPPNQNTCPVCLGLPGALPVLNKRAVDLAIILGLALNCELQRESIWDRKNYFYQDLPKGYQITQFAKPLCKNGWLEITVNDHTKRISIHRIHMEEDAGKSIHEGSGDYSLVDLNRAGVPLCEIVSNPDMGSADEVGVYLRSLRSIVRYAGVCDGNMEQGSLRCDANVSVRPVGQKELGTKVELKNLNSIKFVEKALKYEIERQTAVLSQGGTIAQETRLYDSQRGVTETMRTKEEAHDYRYFPDPDLVPLVVDQQWIETCRKMLPELAAQKAERFVSDYGIPEYDARVLTADKSLADYFEQAVKGHNTPKKISNWIMTELLRELKNDEKEIDECSVPPQNLGRLVALIDNNTVSGKIAKTVFEEMYKSGKDADTVIKEKNLIQITDHTAVEAAIDEAIKANPTQHEQYKQGKDKLFGFFVGQVMNLTKGKANPGLVNELLKKKL